MKHTILMMCAAVAAWGQAPPPKLTCDGPLPVNDGLFPYCEMRETSAPFTGSLAVNTGGSGDVLVQSWDGADVLVRSRVLTAAETTSLAVMVAAMVNLNTADGKVTGNGPASNAHQTWSLGLEIYVPRKLDLSVTTLNGNVSVQDLEAQSGITLTTLNGNVSATGVVGPVELRTTNGNIVTAGVRGRIQFNSINGKVSLTGVAGDVEGSGVNGSILVAADHWVGETFDVKTVNGAIELDVPSDCSAHAELSTVVGSISTNVPVPASKPAKPGSLGKSLSFDIGGGGPLIRATLVVGTIKLTLLD
jgi:DUF4097 and DUF4098 domain-containing protein YvlB